LQEQSMMPEVVTRLSAFHRPAVLVAGPLRTGIELR
jgi:hypothetical protein